VTSLNWLAECTRTSDGQQGGKKIEVYGEAVVQHEGRVETESGGTRRRTGGEVKGKEANGVGSQQSSA